MIPDDVIEQVRQQADIVSIVGEVVKLKRVGHSFRGPCPFHQGKNPNFAVTPGGGYVCFVCGEKGDVFAFVQKRLGMDFVDAVKYVGDKSGVEVREVARNPSPGSDPRERFWEINAAACEYFQQVLWNDPLGGPARDYLASREFARDQAERFGLGFAPRDAELLRAHLAALGYEDELLVQAGLLVQRDNGAPGPRFRNRLMFPIYDAQGRAIAFGGRLLGPGEPKYLNSSDSPTFQKGSTLYGLNWAKHAIRREDRAILVEGYFDCLRVHASGIESTVAPLGTALTDAQAAAIARHTRNAFLLYDSDRPGLKATFRNGDVLLKHGVKVLVITLPQGDDPDTFVRRLGRDGLEAQIANALDVFERKLQILQRGGWLGDLRRKRIALDRLLPTVRAASDSITRALYVARAAEAVGVSPDVLERELKQDRTPRGARATAAPVRSGERRRAFAAAGVSAERQLVRLLLHRRQDIESVAERVGSDSFRDATLGAIFTALTAAPDQPLDELAPALGEEAIPILNELAMDGGGLELPQRIIEDCLTAIRQREIGERMEALDRELPLADAPEKDALMSEKNRLQRELQSLGAPRRWKSFGRNNL